MAKLSSQRLDPEKAKSGVWVDYSDGIRLKIARHRNVNYSRFIAGQSRDVLQKLRDGDPETNDRVTREATGRTVLVGWENIEDDNGQPIPYSEEKSVEFMSDPQLSEIYEFVVLQSMMLEKFRVESVGN